MKYLGGLVLLNVIIVVAYFSFGTQVSGKRIALFGGIGLFLGIALMLCDRITGVKVPGVGEITTAVEKATSGAEEVEKIQKEVEKHRDAIALIVRDANAARDDLSKVRSLSNEAKLQSDKLSKVFSQAFDDLRTTSDLGLLLTKASNDDRPAFDSILKISRNQKHRFCDIANKALIKIITDPQVTGLLSYPIHWKKDHNLDPAQATLEEFLPLCF